MFAYFYDHGTLSFEAQGHAERPNVRPVLTDFGPLTHY